MASRRQFVVSFTKFLASLHSKEVTKVDFSEEYSNILISELAAGSGLVKLDNKCFSVWNLDKKHIIDFFLLTTNHHGKLQEVTSTEYLLTVGNNINWQHTQQNAHYNK